MLYESSILEFYVWHVKPVEMNNHYETKHTGMCRNIQSCFGQKLQITSYRSLFKSTTSFQKVTNSIIHHFISIGRRGDECTILQKIFSVLSLLSRRGWLQGTTVLTWSHWSLLGCDSNRKVQFSLINFPSNSRKVAVAVLLWRFVLQNTITIEWENLLDDCWSEEREIEWLRRFFNLPLGDITPTFPPKCFGISFQKEKRGLPRHLAASKESSDTEPPTL